VVELPSISNNLQGPLSISLGEEKLWKEEKIPLPHEETCLNTHFDLSTSSLPGAISTLLSTVLVKM